MDEFYLLVLIAILSLMLVFTVLLLIIYAGGLFSEVKVSVAKPPVGDITVYYKFSRGPYKNCGSIFTEVTIIAPDKRCFGVYYDDPKKISAEKLRWAVGIIVADGHQIAEDDTSLVEKLEKKGYKRYTFPETEQAVVSTYPYINFLSILCGVWRVYPALSQYIKEKRLCAHPFLEVYQSQTIHYIAPLSKQEKFYVPETGDCDEAVNNEEKSLLSRNSSRKVRNRKIQSVASKDLLTESCGDNSGHGEIPMNQQASDSQAEDNPISEHSETQESNLNDTDRTLDSSQTEQDTTVSDLDASFNVENLDNQQQESVLADSDVNSALEKSQE